MESSSHSRIPTLSRTYEILLICSMFLQPQISFLYLESTMCRAVLSVEMMNKTDKVPVLMAHTSPAHLQGPGQIHTFPPVLYNSIYSKDENSFILLEYLALFVLCNIYVQTYLPGWTINIFFLNLFLAVLGLCCCVWAFSSCGERGLLFVAVHGLLIVEHGL